MDTTMQAIVTLAGSARGIAPAWTNFEAWRRISTLVDEYSKAKIDLEMAEIRHSSQLHGLTEHRVRIQSSLPRLETAADYYSDRLESDPKAPEELTSVTELIDIFTDAIVVINDRLRPIEDDLSDHKIAVDRALTLLLNQLQEIDPKEEDGSFDATTGVLDFEVTRDIVLNSTLDMVEEELADFEEKRQLDDWKDATSDIYRLDPEIARRDREEIDLLDAWGDLKSRQRQLAADVQSEDVEKELKELEGQVQELSHQLALLGIPMKDNSIVSWHSGDGDVIINPVDAAQQKDHEIDHLVQTDDEQNNPDTQRGLFDGFDIEKPNACMDPEEMPPPTRAEIQFMVEKLQTRIHDWMDSVDDDGDGFSQPEVLPVEEHKGDLDSLAEISPEDSITRILGPARFSKRELDVLESRRRAWAVQLDRDRRETALRIEEESPEIERPPGFEEWLE